MMVTFILELSDNETGYALCSKHNTGLQCTSNSFITDIIEQLKW